MLGAQDIRAHTHSFNGNSSTPIIKHTRVDGSSRERTCVCTLAQPEHVPIQTKAQCNQIPPASPKPLRWRISSRHFDDEAGIKKH